MYEPIEIHVIPSKYGEAARLEYSEVVGAEAHLAQELIRAWGMVAAIGNGEDSAGRAKLRLQTPAELVDRATATAEAFFTEVRARGWTTKIPPKLVEAGKESA